MSRRRVYLPARIECEHVLPIAAEADVEDLAQRLVHLLVSGFTTRSNAPARSRGPRKRASVPATHTPSSSLPLPLKIPKENHPRCAAWRASDPP
jgi:hypothetical protein